MQLNKPREEYHDTQGASVIKVFDLTVEAAENGEKILNIDRCYGHEEGRAD